jgi:uncharacterized protein YjbJ (UPF0337 family)
MADRVFMIVSLFVLREEWDARRPVSHHYARLVFLSLYRIDQLAILERYIDQTVVLDAEQTNNEDEAMDKDRIKGSTKQAKGAVKETAGKILCDKKLETEGKADQAAGKVQNAIGGLKDAMRGG